MWSNVLGCLVVIAVAGIVSWILAPEEDKEEKRED
jgi:hypothetical protein